MELFKEKFEKEAQLLSESPGSVLLTKGKFDSVVEHLKQPEKTHDAHFRYWVKKKQFSLMNIPGLGIVDVLVVPNEKCKDAGSASYLRVLHAENVVSVLHEIHATELNHSGYKKVLDYSQRQYQGPTRGFVQKFCSQCPTCQLRAPQIFRPQLKPMIEKDFMEHIQIDLIDMRHSPDGDYHYIAHFMDHFTKFRVLFPLKTKSAAEVAKLLEERVLAYFGPPKVFYSDNGREFINQVMRALFESWGGHVTFVNGRPQHSQSQGNRTVEKKLAALKVDKGCDSNGNYPWASWLPRVMFSLNTEVQRTTNEPPYKVVLGRLPPTGLFPGAESITEEEDIHHRQDESNQKFPRLIPTPGKSLRPEEQSHEFHVMANPLTHLCKTDPDPPTHLSETDPDPLTQLSETDPDPLTHLCKTDPDLLTHLCKTDPLTKLSETDPDPLTKLSETDPDPLTQISETDPDQLTKLSETDPNPLTQLSETDPDPLTQLSETDPNPLTKLSVTDPNPLTQLSETDPDPLTQLSEAPDRHTIVRKRAYRKTVKAAKGMEHSFNKKKKI